jgi:CheY-like chemotaxis protein
MMVVVSGLVVHPRVPWALAFASAATTGAPGCLLVVEDDEDMRALIRELVTQEGGLTVVGEAVTADEAVELATSTQPDLVILDHFLFGTVRGLDVSAQLRLAAPSARILVLSSHNNLQVEAERDPSVDAFVWKQHLSDFMPSVRRLLGLSEPPPARC